MCPSAACCISNKINKSCRTLEIFFIRFTHRKVKLDRLTLLEAEVKFRAGVKHSNAITDSVFPDCIFPLYMSEDIRNEVLNVRMKTSEP